MKKIDQLTLHELEIIQDSINKNEGKFILVRMKSTKCNQCVLNRFDKHLE
jgi:hypothetical protein